MTTHFAHGSATTVLSDDDLGRALHGVFARFGAKRKVLAVPPDYTRFNSRAGVLTRHAYEYYQGALSDVLPALGTAVSRHIALRALLRIPLPALAVPRVRGIDDFALRRGSFRRSDHTTKMVQSACPGLELSRRRYANARV